MSGLMDSALTSRASLPSPFFSVQSTSSSLNRASTTACLPALAARCSAVLPCWSRTLTDHWGLCCASRYCSTFFGPNAAAYIKYKYKVSCIVSCISNNNNNNNGNGTRCKGVP